MTVPRWGELSNDDDRTPDLGSAFLRGRQKKRQRPDAQVAPPPRAASGTNVLDVRASHMNDAFLKVYFDKARAAHLTIPAHRTSASPLAAARCMNRGAFYASASSKRGPAADRVGRAPGPPLNALPREGPIWPGCRPSRSAVPALRRAAAPAPSSPGFSGNGPACGRRRASLLQGSVGASCGQGIDSLPRRDPGGRRLRRTGAAGRGAG